MQVESGNVLAAKMNSHRHQWNGTICSQPQAWNCGADPSFRANYCDSGNPRCFHLDVFRSNGPRFFTPDTSVLLAVQRQAALLDDQILVFYGGRFGAQQGIAPGDHELTLFGFYHIKHASLDASRTPHRLVIEPHADAWAMFPRMHLRPTVLRSISGVAYLRQFRATGLKDAIDEALETSGALPKSEGWTPDLQHRLQRASTSLSGWLQQAERARASLPEPTEPPRMTATFGNLEGPMAAKLKGIKIAVVPEPGRTPAHEAPASPGTASAPTPVAPAAAVDGATAGAEGGGEAVLALQDESPAPTQPSTEPTLPASTSGDVSTKVQAVPETHGRQLLAAQFGAPLVDALSVAFDTKGLVILTGAPGAGKSWIASRLLDDHSRERTVIVPVASTWRGREDLLGYVNPITGCFEASEFTHFLCDTQRAWESGDRRTRLVVFEEFNLSQPEHWLSDLLVRLEYEPDQLADRTIRLGGKEITGRPGRSCSVVLVPSLRFVATLNNDHTVKPLSPRVLDRAALIEVVSSGRAALSRAGVELSDAVEDVIDELNELLESRGAAFSVRSARSLQRAIQAGNNSGMTLARALDLVLVQEVLSRVRLLAGDHRDEQLLARLQSWTQKPGCTELTGCAARIADWADLLSAGRDVFQA